MAAVRVVLPWSTWPIVPTLTWGLERVLMSYDMPRAMARRKPDASLTLQHDGRDGTTRSGQQDRVEPARAPHLWRKARPGACICAVNKEDSSRIHGSTRAWSKGVRDIREAERVLGSDRLSAFR